MPLNIEEPIDPAMPIIDAHHHLFDRLRADIAAHVKTSRFMIDEYVEQTGQGHNVIGSVAVAGHWMWRADGPQELRPLGETEFFNGQAAMSSTGLYGPVSVAAGLVGTADLSLGDDARVVLEAHIRAAPDRFRGVRVEAVWDEDARVLGGIFNLGAHYYSGDAFRKGFAHLAPLGLTFDAFVIAPQLPDVLGLARSFPDTSIILDHLGNPVGIGRHEGRLEENFPVWKKDMADIARCPNVVVKMGGLNSFLAGSPNYRLDSWPSSRILAEEWKPYAEAAIELFGADRVMFESNLPTDGSGPFAHVVNAYQRITEGCTAEEKRSIFAGTANRIYRLGLEDRIAAASKTLEVAQTATS